MDICSLATPCSHESGMRNHPLTPMTDANLVRVLQAQLNRRKGRRVGLIDYRTVSQSGRGDPTTHERSGDAKASPSPSSMRSATRTWGGWAKRCAVLALPHRRFRPGRQLAAQLGFQLLPTGSDLPPARGRKAILAGSCSVATNAQVQRFIRDGGEAFALQPAQLARGSRLANCPGALLGRCLLAERSGLPAAASTQPRSLRVGVSAGMRALVERAHGSLGAARSNSGVGSLVVAGGETAGICVQALNIRQMQIGPQIDPGVPWCYATSAEGGLHIALKSGNFGSPDFFCKAFAFVA